MPTDRPISHSNLLASVLVNHKPAEANLLIMLPNKTLQNVAHSSLCSFCFLLRYQRVAVRSRIVYALPGRGFLAEAFAGLSSL